MYLAGAPRALRGSAVEMEASQARAAGRQQQAAKVALVVGAVWLVPRVDEQEVAEHGKGAGASASGWNGEARIAQGEAHRLGSRRGRHRGR